MLEPVHFPQFMAPRLQATIQRLEASVWSVQKTQIQVSATVSSPDIVDAPAAKRLTYKPVTRLPQFWGRMFDQRWWKLKLPKKKTGSATRYLYWTDQAEATVYHEGEPIFGIDPGHMYCPIPDDAHELLIESTCCRTGVWVPSNMAPMSKHGSEFNGAFLASRDDDAWHAMIDLKVLTETLSLIHLPDYPASNQPTAPFGYRPPIHQAPPVYRTVLRQLNDAIDIYENQGPAALRQALRKIYRDLDIPNRSHTAILTGHAHIDLVWLWPKHVARFKAVHSFANVLSVMQRYPKCHFGYSQPASYQDTQRLAPGLMQRVREKIRKGNWEATGTMYVESDTQLPCGEALVRSFELGRKGFLELNGKRRRQDPVVWLPDTFGYSASIPQIMAGFGIPYFYTTKIHWGSATQLPYTSFRWRGNDGSEVLTHIIQSHYNQEAKPAQYRDITLKHQQADIHPEVLIPTGYGDGGGGPNDEMAERVERLSKLGLLGEAASVPDAKWGRIDQFFDRLNKQRSKLPTWHGEMFLQYHRGVQTTHGDLKAAYRSAERALQVWEAVRCATGKGPVDERAWKTVVFCQFHDCLPGSSIHEVCAEAVEELQAVTDCAINQAQEELNSRNGKPCIFNPLALPNYHVTDEKVLAAPPLAGVLESELKSLAASPPKATKHTLENEHVSVQFDLAGQITSLKIDDKPIQLDAPGAQLWSFADKPVQYDAWDIDRPTLSNGERVTTPAKVTIEKRNTLNAAVCFSRNIGKQSQATIRYRIDPARPVLLIDFDIDWQEPQTLLKIAFPTSYRGKMARYGSPFGSTLRSQLSGTIETDAMYEAPASRWAAVTNDTETDGLSLISESKYGFGCMNGLLHLSLLRSAKITQPVTGPPRRRAKGQRGDVPIYSDLGKHTIHLAVGRYDCNRPVEQQPAALAETLFNQPFTYTGKPISAGLRTIVTGPGVVPAWAKPIKPGLWSLRLHEILGRAERCKVQTHEAAALTRLDLNDKQQTRVTSRGLTVKPYQIVSVGITRH